MSMFNLINFRYFIKIYNDQLRLPLIHNLECLSNVEDERMKHNLAPGVKDKPTGLCRAACVSHTQGYEYIIWNIIWTGS